ncbi:MAG: hypothetical protein V1494_06955 [Candidatus Diapherotrites archaeon]
MNVILRGKSKETLELMIEAGYANSLSEAIRLAITHFGKEHFVGEKSARLEKQLKESSLNALQSEDNSKDYLKHLT